MNWKLMKLGALLTQSKVPSTTADTNRRIRVKLNVGGVEKRPVSNEVEGATNYYSRKAGQFIFGTQNFHKGAFGIIPPELDGFETSNDIPSFDVSKDCLPDWIFFYFKVGDRYKELEKLARGVGSKRVHPKQIFELVIPVPPVAKQLEIIEQVQVSAARQRMIVEEADKQLDYLTQLRQALLREAMQGQLLPQDPADEPAALLLEKLQGAKEATIKPSRVKPGVLFAEEVESVIGLFDTPTDWLWCRLNQIATVSSGSTPKPDAFIEKGGVPYLKMYNLVNQKIDFDYRPQYIKQEVHNSLLKRSITRPGDVLMNIVGPPLGKLAIVPETFPEWNMNQAIVMINSGEKITNKWIYWFLREGSAIATVELKGMAGQDNISVNQTRAFPIPLPPLAEQHRIVAKLEQLMQHCDALEQRIRESRQLAEQLLQTALREALAPPAGTEPAEEVELELAEAEATPAPARRGRPRQPKFSLDNPQPDLFDF
jgi:type I restriction enzyme S subunit